MSSNSKKLQYSLPTGVDFLRIVQNTILDSLRNGTDIKLNMPPLIQRAYNLVNETGIIPYRDYERSVKITDG
jgi:hypothetical protein